MHKRKKSKNKSANLKRLVLKTFKKNSRKKLNASNIIKKAKLNTRKDLIENVLQKLVKEGSIIALNDGKYVLNKSERPNATIQLKEFTGRVDLTKSGAAYIVTEEHPDDIYVPAKHLETALNGDTVKIKVQFGGRRYKPEGKVIEVIKRNSTHFIGVLRRFQQEAIVYVNTKDGTLNIHVAKEHLNNGRDSEKVVVKINEWRGSKIKTAWGEITEVLGAAGSNDIEMKSILLNQGFPLSFSEEAMKESESMNFEILDEDLKKRRDVRSITTFTIDPATAKDFDDALSIRKVDGLTEIGIHIADVSHYVRSGTQLDKEAYDRSTSVYLVDRVLPMLPEKISNELCSLRPDEDKFCYSAIFEFNENDKIVSEWFGRTIIHSDRRFTYEEAQEVIENEAGDFAEEILELNRIAKVLRKEKFKNGAINFESEEVVFKLDGEGKPLEIVKKIRKDAHLLVEDFMLLANKAVASFMSKKSKPKEVPFVYRVHDTPNMEKLADLSLFAKEMGVKMKIDTPNQISKSLNNLAKLAQKDDALKMLQPMAIRCMAKAEYTSNNIGHYGLAFENYTHFTSPIRRYSDVLVHRILEKNLESKFYVKKDDLEARCQHISAQERKAMDAERESVKFKQVEYIQEHVGEEFDGIISGLIDKGFFVELIDSKVEGFVPFSNLNENYSLADSRLLAKGTRTGQVMKMGQKLKVKIISANLDLRQIEMDLV